MRDYKILLVDGDSQNLQELGRFLNERGCPVTKVFNTNTDGEMLRQKAFDSTSELQKFTPTDDILTMLKIMSLDIQGPLVSMLATLKLLNRGYYGKMDEEVANKIKKLLSNATFLIGITEEFLGRASAANEEFEIEAEPLHSIQEIINPVGALKQQNKRNGEIT